MLPAAAPWDHCRRSNQNGLRKNHRCHRRPYRGRIRCRAGLNWRDHHRRGWRFSPLSPPFSQNACRIFCRVYITAVAITGPSLNVSLALSNSIQNEVVVIGYGTQLKKDLTGSVASVNAKDFQKGAITSIDQLIAGKIAGVSVTSNGGQPGSCQHDPHPRTFFD